MAILFLYLVTLLRIKRLEYQILVLEDYDLHVKDFALFQYVLAYGISLPSLCYFLRLVDITLKM